MKTDWNRLVREHGSMVFGTAWRILGHAADTEDVVQEVFLEVHRLWRTRPVRHWPAFLRRMATCRALDRVRQRKEWTSLSGLALPDNGYNPVETAIEHELAERLRTEIGHLPEQEGAVFSLHYFEDLSYQQIADALDISPGAVAQALHKARGKLEKKLNAQAAASQE